LVSALKENAIPTARYYPKLVHMQMAYTDFSVAPKGLPNTMDCISKVISLPMHAYLEPATQYLIIKTAKEAVN